MATIDYKEKYEKAVQSAMLAKQDTESAVTVQTLEEIFPELRESEDERISKEIISAIKEDWPGHTDWIAWLEAQGEHAKFRNKIQIGDKVTRNEDGILVNLSQLQRVAKKDEKQREQKPFISNDALREGIAYFGITQYQIDNWLKKYVDVEKQGEQKHADRVEPKFKAGDWAVSKFDGKARQISEVHYDEYNNYYVVGSHEYDIEDYDRLHHLWTIQDAKAGDVLSYRDGQWIFIYKGIITEDTFKYYALLSEKGITVNDAAFSLLASCIIPATKEQCDLLFSKMKEAGYEWDAKKKELKKIEQKPVIEMKTPEESLGIDSDTYNKIVDECVYGKQKSAWSEEDEKFVHGLIRGLAAKRDIHGHTTFSSDYIDITETINWLKSLKDKVQPQPSQEWSEEDDFMVENVRNSFGLHCGQMTDALKEQYDKFFNKVKSLRPQNTWKPSDEQISVLEFIMEDIEKDSIRYRVLNSVLEQLKKLKRE